MSKEDTQYIEDLCNSDERLFSLSQMKPNANKPGEEEELTEY